MRIRFLFLICISSFILTGCRTRGYGKYYPEFVDLGLSVKWATCNIGAQKPNQYGGYFAWGETSTKDYYDDDNYSIQERYNTKGVCILDSLDDAAYMLWGEDWRIPTKEEIQELKQKCRWQWTILNNTYGYKVTGPNGNSIFLPAAGLRFQNRLELSEINAYYWSSSLDKTMADLLLFDSSVIQLTNLAPSVGRSIRPVLSSQKPVPVKAVKIRQKTHDLNIGEQYTFTAEVTPSNAVKKYISWSSSNPSVATVDSYGTVTAVSKGKCTITASRGTFSDRCQLVVR